MNRIDTLYSKKTSDILSVYFTAGFPKLKDTVEILKALENNGVDMVELGIPFSDPMADGVVIQQSSQKALENGMSLKKLFTQIKDIRKEVQMPIILMGYLNPVMQYGIEAFCKTCKSIGIDGVILPDLPLKEYKENYKSVFEKNGLHNIFLISPQTGEERIKLIDKESNGFIYMVASSSTTGAKSSIEEEQEAYFNRIKRMDLKNPQIIGFGISNNKTFTKACKYASGAIIGSAFVKALEGSNNINKTVKEFIRSIKEPLKNRVVR